jgi:hypothetical protein
MNDAAADSAITLAQRMALDLPRRSPGAAATAT